MSKYRASITTMQTILAGSVVARNTAVLQKIHDELEDIDIISTPKPPNTEKLLTIIYFARALDSFLLEFLNQHKINLSNKERSMSGYLKKLNNHKVKAIAKLPSTKINQYKKNIIYIRNIYAHQARSFPTDAEINNLLSHMHACMTEVAGL